MNLPNQLTVARFFLTIIFVAALSSEWRFGYTVGLLVFIAAGVTDYFDGAIARRRNLVTDFGKLMDPLADKIMIAAAFICLVPIGAVPAWVATTVVARDFLITGLRLIASAEGQVLPAERLGKHKTSWQIVTILFFLVLLAARELKYAGLESGWWSNAWYRGGPVLIWIAVALTLYSGLGYAWRHRQIITPQ